MKKKKRPKDAKNKPEKDIKAVNPDEVPDEEIEEADEDQPMEVGFDSRKYENQELERLGYGDQGLDQDDKPDEPTEEERGHAA